MKKPRLLWACGLLVLLVATAACSPKAAATPTPEAAPATKSPTKVIAEGRVEPVRFAEIALKANGLVAEVLNKEGDRVAAGQVIARLENSQAKTLQTAQADALQAVSKAYDSVRDAQYEMDIFDVLPEFSGTTPAQAVQDALQKLNVAREAFAPYRYLDEKQLQLTEAEEDQDNLIIRNTPKRLKKAQDDAWDRYRKAVQWLEREAALENAQTQLAQAQKDFDSLHDASFAENTAGTRAALASAELRAPFAGVITNLDMKVGEFAASGTTVATVADLTGWVVKTTDLTEIDVVHIKEGQPVTVVLDALPDVTIKGYVLSVAQNFSERQGDVVYKVTVLLANKNPAVRWGMTAQVDFGD